MAPAQQGFLECRFLSGFDGSSRTARARGPLQTAMETEQTRGRERYRRPIAAVRAGGAEKSFYKVPLSLTVTPKSKTDIILLVLRAWTPQLR